MIFPMEQGVFVHYFRDIFQGMESLGAAAR